MEIVIGRELHARWNQDDPHKKSCAVNTLSHEILHGFARGNATWYHEDYFVDTRGASGAGGVQPIATYYVGSVAQCTWLQDRGHIDEGTDGLRSCLTRYGTDRFLSQQCEPDPAT